MHLLVKIWGLVAFLCRGVLVAGADCPLVIQQKTSPTRLSNLLRASNAASIQRESRIRIVQYNAEWLFLNYYAPMDCPGNGCTWQNQSEAEKHAQYVAAVVKDLQPDIMNVCEVEGCYEMSELLDQVAANVSYNVYLKQGTDTATGQNVGLMTAISPVANLTRTEERMAYPLADSKCAYDGPNGTVGVSKHYLTEYILYGRRTLFVGLHLLAYPEDATRCAEREAQAQIIQNVVADYIREVGGEVIVLGDFNDFDGTVLDANRNAPTSRVLEILKGGDGKYAGEYELRSAAEKIPEVERFSDWWDENVDCVSTADEFSLIDHVLVSPFLFERIEDAFVYHGYDEFCGKYDSDHYPLVVDFASNE
jgi:hypothetical protein